MSDIANEDNGKSFQQQMIEYFNSFRHFEIELPDGTKRKAEIRIPTAEESRSADAYAASVIEEKSVGETDPITGKVSKRPLKANMMEYAKEKGIWTEKDDFAYDTLDSQIRSKSKRLVQGNMKLSEAYNLAMEIYEHRKEMFPYTRLRWEIYDKTADAAGEEAMHRYICVATAVWENGERIFQNISAFEKGGSIRDQVTKQYKEIMRVQHQYLTPMDIELAFFQDYGFMSQKNEIYDLKKEKVVFKLEGDEETIDSNDGFAGFTDDDGNVVEPTGMLIDESSESEAPVDGQE